MKYEVLVSLQFACLSLVSIIEMVAVVGCQPMIGQGASILGLFNRKQK